MISAKCHCGAVELNVDKLPQEVTHCNCSICRRLGARWIYYKKTEVNIINRGQTIKAYQWGDRMIKFYHCTDCGCSTHYMTNTSSGINRVGINSNMIDPDLIKGLKIRFFNGADM